MTLPTHITADTTLVSGCEYFLTGQLHVAEGAILTIPSNVAMRFNPDTAYGSADYGYLYVDGALRVEGVPGGEVVFTRSGETGYQPWDGIKLSSDDNTATSSIRHAVIEFAATGLEVSDGAQTILEDITLRYNAIPFVFHTAAALIRSQVIDNTREGVLVGGGSTLDRVSFTGNGTLPFGRALKMCPGSTIVNSTFANNNAVAIHMDCSPYVEPPRTITHTTIISNTFTGNYGVFVDARTETNYSISMLKNNITGNHPIDPSIWFFPTSNTAVLLSCRTKVNGNNIHDNTSLYALRYFEGSSAEPCQVDATGNWWGTGDLDVVDALVYDSADSSDPFFHGTIQYEPISTSPIPDAGPQ